MYVFISTYNGKPNNNDKMYLPSIQDNLDKMYLSKYVKKKKKFSVPEQHSGSDLTSPR